MKEARITVKVGTLLDVHEAVCYEDAEEEAKLMGFIRDRIREGIKANYRGLKRAFMVAALPKGVKLMQEIVKRANAEFKWSDRLYFYTPACWNDFRMWAIRRGFLAIKELEVKNVPC